VVPGQSAAVKGGLVPRRSAIRLGANLARASDGVDALNGVAR
jgi:hypothetical protein